MAKKLILPPIPSNNTFLEFLKRNRERVVLVGVVLVFLLIVGGGLLLQKEHRMDKEQPLVRKAAQLPVSSDGGKGGSYQAVQSGQQEPFFLRPSPDELLHQLGSMENLNPNVVEAKFKGFRVLWPVYYFGVESTDGKTTLLLDVSEDGFGVLIESEIELSAYPEINGLHSGQKIWIGGEILAVDPSGTGTIYLKTEHLQFNGEQPYEIGQLQTN